MAGGKITRIVGGTNSIECKTWRVYTDNFYAYAGNGSHFTAEKGTNFGEPKDPPPVGKYIANGWWADKDGNKIKNAKICDKVYFHVEMTEKFPDKKINVDEQHVINFKLFEFDGNFYKPSVVFIKNYIPPFPPILIVPEKKPKKNKEIKYITWEEKITMEF